MSHIRACLPAISLAALLVVASPPLAAGDGAFLRLSPYGDPFRLVPGAVIGAVSAVPRLVRAPDGHAFEPRGTRALRLAPSPLAVKKAAGTEDDDDDDDDDPRPTRPGTLPTNFVKIPDPTPQLKARTLGPHLRPDAEFSLGDSATLGLLGQVDRARPLPSGSSPTGNLQRLLPAAAASHVPQALRGRDLGFGASLEFKLGR